MVARATLRVPARVPSGSTDDLPTLAAQGRLLSLRQCMVLSLAKGAAVRHCRADGDFLARAISEQGAYLGASRMAVSLLRLCIALSLTHSLTLSLSLSLSLSPLTDRMLSHSAVTWSCVKQQQSKHLVLKGSNVSKVSNVTNAPTHSLHTYARLVGHRYSGKAHTRRACWLPSYRRASGVM